MERNNRKICFDILTRKKSELAKIINNYNLIGDDFSDVKQEVEEELKDVKAKIQKAYDNSIPILITSCKVSDADDNFFDRDMYAYFYYLVDLDTVRRITSFEKDDFLKNTLDFRDFFKQIGLPNNRTIYESSKLYFAERILQYIVLDMFEKMKYSSWDEVKKDLEDVPKNYLKPEKNETHYSYEKRHESVGIGRRINLPGFNEAFSKNIQNLFAEGEWSIGQDNDTKKRVYEKEDRKALND